MKYKKEKSCGCIIINNDKVLLIYERNQNYWGFPKGHVENDETEVETAKREVKEEVGLDVIIDERKKYSINYTFKNRIDKTVIFFLAHPINREIKLQKSEIENAIWLPFDEAMKTLTYDSWKDMLQKALKDIDVTN